MAGILIKLNKKKKLMTTYGEFIELAGKLESLEGTFFVSDYLEDSKRQLEEQREMPLTEELVISFVKDMQYRIRDRLSGICTEGLYDMVRNDGHAFLRAISGLASKLGLNLNLDNIDAPLTLTEMLVKCGYATVKST